MIINKNLTCLTRKSAIVTLGLTLFASTKSFSQSEALTSIQNSINTYHQNSLQEKTFVHTDKSFYLAGEIVWFKIYNVNASNHLLSSVSKIAYVEIIDQDLKPVLQAKVSLTEGTGSGSFFLPFNLNSGNYTFRAYTSWMKNLGVESFFQKDITIVNSLKNIGNASSEKANTTDIQLFPEGGNLVDGIESKVAFELTGANDKETNARGVIVSQNGDTITSFQPNKFGLGSFNLTPRSGNTYRAIIKTNGKDSKTVNLPSSYANGYVMHATETNSGYQVTVKGSADHVNKYVYLLAQNRQGLKSGEAQPLRNGIATFSLDKTNITGITTLTVFDDTKQPVCERLVYTPATQTTTVNANINGNSFAPRTLVTIGLNTNTNTSGNSSLSVYKIDSLQPTDYNTFTNYLAFTSELKGNIKSPEYYLTQPGVEVNIATEDLLLTHGWRKFNWPQILSNKTTFEYLPDFEGNIISGTVLNKRTQQPAAGITVYVTAPGKDFLLSTARTNDRGEFSTVLQKFYGPGELIFETETDPANSYLVNVNSPYSLKYSSTENTNRLSFEKYQQLLATRSIAVQAQNLYNSDSLQNLIAVNNTDTTAFYGKPDEKYFLDNYTRFSTMEEVMREYIPGVSLKKQEEKYHFRNANSPYFRYFNTDPLILLNGVPVLDAENILAYDPLKVQKIEVVTRKYFLGKSSFDGIVSYTTYDGSFDGFKLDPNALIVDYEGLQLQRHFYSPSYTSAAARDSRIPDFRNLLYWSPNINFDNAGKAATSFYTSDLTGHFIGILQGITASGEPISTTFSFEVKK